MIFTGCHILFSGTIVDEDGSEEEKEEMESWDEKDVL